MKETDLPATSDPADFASSPPKITQNGALDVKGTGARRLRFRALQNPDRIGRPRCLENPRPQGGILTYGEPPLSISR